MTLDADTGRGGILALVAGGNFAQLGARLLIGPIVPLVLIEFDATKSGVGLALTGMWALYALLQFPSGVLADRFGERRLLAVGLFGTAVGTGFIALAPNLWLFAAAVLVLGAGSGLFFSPATALLSRLFTRRGRALGLLTAGGAFAGVVFPAVGSAVGVRYGWRPAVTLGTVVAAPVFLGTVRYLPRMEPVNPDRRLTASIDLGRVLELFGRPSLTYSAALAVLVGFTFQALSSFLPTFLVEYRDIDPGLAGVLFAAVFGLSAMAQPIAGRLSDATSRDVAIAGSATLTALGLSVLLSAPGRAGLFGGIALVGVGVSWPGPIQARIVDQLAAEERGFGFGLVRTVYMLLAASGSVIVGSLADIGGWLPGYGAVVLLLVTCIGLILGNRLTGAGL